MKYKEFRKLFNIFVIFITIYLTIRLLSNSYLELDEITKNLNYNYLILSICSLLICKMFGAYSLLILFNYNHFLDFKYWNRLTFNSQFLNTIPFLGFTYKAVKLKKDHNINYFNYLYLYYFSTLLNLIITLSIILIFYFLPQQFDLFHNEFYLTILVLLILLIFFLLFIGKFKFFFKNNSKNFISIFFKKKYTEFTEINNLIIYNKFLILKFIILHLIEYIFSLLSFSFIFTFLNIDLNFIQISLIFFIFIAMTNIKLLPQNYGVNELIGSFLIGQSHVGFAVGYIVMICIRIIEIISVLILMTIFNLKMIIKFFKTKKV